MWGVCKDCMYGTPELCNRCMPQKQWGGHQGVCVGVALKHVWSDWFYMLMILQWGLHNQRLQFKLTDNLVRRSRLSFLHGTTNWARYTFRSHTQAANSPRRGGFFTQVGYALKKAEASSRKVYPVNLNSNHQLIVENPHTASCLSSWVLELYQCTHVHETGWTHDQECMQASDMSSLLTLVYSLHN